MNYVQPHTNSLIQVVTFCTDSKLLHVISTLYEAFLESTIVGGVISPVILTVTSSVLLLYIAPVISCTYISTVRGWVAG